MGRKAAALRTSAKHCHFSRPHLHQQFYLFLLQALRAAFLPVVSDLWGRVWKGKPCCPFLGCGGLEPHYETGSKFLLLFSIKSKGERLGFAEKVPNGRTHIFARRNLVATALNQCAALLLFSLAHVAFINPIGACTATFPHKKRPLSGLFPSTILHRQVHIRNMLPHGGIRRLIISALNRFDNLPMQLNRHINDSGVLRQRFTHCQTNPVFKGIL